MTAFVYRNGSKFVAHCEQYDLCAQGWTKEQAIDSLRWLLDAYRQAGADVGLDLLSLMGPGEAVCYPCVRDS
jgi:hypothetical protein